ncbi:baculoviral IAP repeat-containing protein 7-B-like [Mytilus trossulus]|uniref:baculoviral IAP repeat-containing protein 7-B-like n=1 Tax=Mytilus trossulus TaxID=6551 RepID=UPI00300734AB
MFYFISNLKYFRIVTTVDMTVHSKLMGSSGEYFNTFGNDDDAGCYQESQYDKLSQETKISTKSHKVHRNHHNPAFDLAVRTITRLSNQKHFELMPEYHRENVMTSAERKARVMQPRRILNNKKSRKTSKCLTYVYDQFSLEILTHPLETHQQRSYSFANWSKPERWPLELVNAGFFSLGDDLKLQCSYCGINTDVRDWKATDKALDKHAELNPHCHFLKDTGYFFKSRINEDKNSKDKIHMDNPDLTVEYDTNSPSYCIKENFEHNDSLHPPKGIVFKYPQYAFLEVRLKTYDKWKFGEKQIPWNLSESGYFYTGEGDIVRCFCCDLGLAEWDVSDDPWTEHSRHSPKCWFLLHEKGKDFVERIQADWRKIYNPKHAAYDDKLSRMATFEGVWRSDIEQTSEMLADAGFFYEGEEDTVRCHYCDGGLRNWEPGDVPWEEHARWFPFCKFVIKMKGREFIDEIKAKYETSAQTETQEPTTETSIRNGAIVKSMLDMGFQMKDMIYAANEYTKHEGNIHYNTEDLCRILIEKQETEKLNLQFGELSIDENQNEEDPVKVREVNKELKKNMMCIRCERTTKSILFVECGHRVTCETCAYDVDFCPYCDVKIKTRLKTYLS